MQTLQWLTIYCKVAIEFWILAFEELPHSRSDSDKSSKKCPSDPVVRVDRCILIDRSVSLIGREKYGWRDREKSLLHLGIGIDRRDESMLRIESDHLLILFHHIGDIGSLHTSFSLDSIRMDDIHDTDSFPAMVLHYMSRVSLSIWSTCLGREEDSDVFSIAILGRYHRKDTLFDDIVRLSIYRYDDDVLEIFPVSLDRLIMREISLLIS